LLAAFGFLILTGCSGISSGSKGSSPQNNNNPPAPGAGQLAVSPATLQFGNVGINNPAALTGTLTASNADVTVSSADWSGSGYSVSGISFPITITAGKSANYTVTFTPPAAGVSPGGITFLSNASDPSLNQTFSGDGAPGAPGQHSVALSWNPSLSLVIGYNVYRGTQPSGPYTKLNSSLEPATAFTDSTVVGGTTYYYVATSVDSNNLESAYSNQAIAQIPGP
jgi:hypothetical protein